jgi:hypothetical protein
LKRLPACTGRRFRISGGRSVGIYYTRTARKARIRAHLADAAAGLLFGARLGALFGLLTLPFLFH